MRFESAASMVVAVERNDKDLGRMQPMLLRRICAQGATMLLTLWLLGGPVFGNGIPLKDGRYMERKGSADVMIRVRIDAVSFNLLSLGGKYKIIPIRVRNWGKSPLKFSLTKDRVQLTFNQKRPDEKKLDAVLDLAVYDPTLWGSLSTREKMMLSYPDVVPSKEETLVVALVPTADIPLSTDTNLLSLPDLIVYSIRTLATPIRLEPPQSLK